VSCRVVGRCRCRCSAGVLTPKMTASPPIVYTVYRAYQILCTYDEPQSARSRTSLTPQPLRPPHNPGPLNLPVITSHHRTQPTQPFTLGPKHAAPCKQGWRLRKLSVLHDKDQARSRTKVKHNDNGQRTKVRVPATTIGAIRQPACWNGATPGNPSFHTTLAADQRNAQGSTIYLTKCLKI
jgi:hypothetical protein